MAKKINVKLILELRDAKMGRNAIASTRHMSRNSVSDVFHIADKLGISYQDICSLDEDTVYRMFYPDKHAVENMYQDPEYEMVHKELKKVTCQFIHRNTDVIFQGFTGSGKTYLACAIGKQACKQQIRTRYIRLPDLLVEHDEATMVQHSNLILLKKYSSYALLIIDEWLLNDISEDEQHFLFELIERRHDSTSTIFCTQYREADWHARLGGGVHADAILDRIVHNAVWIETGDMNMREYCAKHQL